MRFDWQELQRDGASPLVVQRARFRNPRFPMQSIQRARTWQRSRDQSFCSRVWCRVPHVLQDWCKRIKRTPRVSIPQEKQLFVGCKEESSWSDPLELCQIYGEWSGRGQVLPPTYSSSHWSYRRDQVNALNPISLRMKKLSSSNRPTRHKRFNEVSHLNLLQTSSWLIILEISQRCRSGSLWDSLLTQN